MSTRKETVRVCDVCKLSVSDEAEPRYGGSAFDGWFNVHETSGRTDLDSLGAVHDWDVCGVKCLQKLAKEMKP